MSNWISFFITLLNYVFLLKWYNSFGNVFKSFCCAPQLPLILTAKFHSLYVEESESGILEMSWAGVGYFCSATLIWMPRSAIIHSFRMPRSAIIHSFRNKTYKGQTKKKFFWEVKTKDTNFALNGLPVKIISCYCTRFMQMLSELHRKNDQQTNRNHVNT